MNIKKFFKKPWKIYKTPVLLYKWMFKKCIKLQAKRKVIPSSYHIVIMFAGEYYNGNLKALYENLKKERKIKGKSFSLLWVYKDLRDRKKLKNYGVRPLWFYGLWNIKKFFKTHIWFNDRGSGDIPIPKLSESLWVQVWHGIPFKGFKGDKNLLADFEKFDLHPVSSEWLKNYYIHAIGVNPKKVIVTGYPREDLLLTDFYKKEKIIKELKIPKGLPIILYAPTWSHESGRIKPLFPFKNNIKILERLENFLSKNKLFMIIRLHPNWMKRSLKKENKEIIKKLKKIKNILLTSVIEDWDTEKYLSIADMLITDWSSIANDYIVLDKPMIFIDIPYKIFKFGFALQPHERPGEIVRTEEEFFEAILQNLKHPKKFSKKREKIRRKVHYKMDGKASTRVLQEVFKRFLGNGKVL